MSYCSPHLFPSRNERARNKNTDRQVIESYWNGKASEEELKETSKTVRKQRWDAMKNAGVDIIPSYVFLRFDLFETID
jgi:hypothetical protein